MKRNAILILTAIAAIPILAVNQTFGEDRTARLEALVDEYIATCESKSDLLDSKSDNIRQAAHYACFKGKYCKTRRDELVDELQAKNIPPVKHKVHYYLNSRLKKMNE